MKNPKISKTCCQCSLPVWRGMFCPTCGAVATAECHATSLSMNHRKSLGEIGEVVSKTHIRTMRDSGGPITKPLAITILSCLPHNESLWQKADECRRRLANRLLAQQARIDGDKQQCPV